MLELRPADLTGTPTSPRTSLAQTAASGHVQQRVDSRRLLGGGRELVIEHAGQEYHLRLTRNDKLILTK